MIDDNSVKKSLYQLSEQLNRTDEKVAARLRSLGDAMTDSQLSDAWSASEVYKMIDPNTIVDRYKSQKASNLRQTTAWLTWMRNSLIFAPLFLTIYSIVRAIDSYSDLVRSSPQQISEPFLLLWQTGFGGRLSAPFTVGSIGTIDFLLLMTILVLTMTINSLSQVNLREEQIAEHLHSDLEDALTNASLILAAKNRQLRQSIDFVTSSNATQSSSKEINTPLMAKNASHPPILSNEDNSEKQQENGHTSTVIHGPVQGLIQGEYNTVTLIFRDNEKQTIPFLAPPQSSNDLIGRDELIRMLKHRLFNEGDIALSALDGLPGVGKTALALVLAHDKEVLGHFCDGVLWAGLGRESNVFSHLNAWGLALGISQNEIEKQINFTALMQTVHRTIGTRRMLLVVDDAWSVEAALSFKLGGPNCAHLVTTRLPEVAEAFTSTGTITVQELSEEDSFMLLEKLAPGIGDAVPQEARELIHAVGGLPLPLTLIGKYLRTQMRSGQPRRLYAAIDLLRQVKERLQVSQPQIGLEHHPSLPEGVPSSQLEIIKISDEAIDEKARLALRALSVFPSKPNSFSEAAALAVAATSIKTIDTLTDFGLLEVSGPERYTLHQTINDYAKLQLIDTTTYERMVEFYINFVETHKTNNSLFGRETSNILAAVQMVFEREMHPQGVSAFAHFIQILRQTRAI